MKFKFYLSALFLILLSSSCQSQSQKDDFSAKIDSLLKTNSVRDFNGTILISQKEKTKYSKSFGFKNKTLKTKLKIDENFLINSISKQITAVLVLIEVDKGKINLQEKIKKYLPELNDSWADSITVHQLLNHTSGIDMIGKPLLYKPGSSFNYGNQTFNLLGKIVSKINKKPYGILANNLFKKLKMNHTFADPASKEIQLVSGHINDKKGFEVFGNPEFSTESTPAAGIISTVEDLTIWNNNLHYNKILKPKTYQKMISYNVKAQHFAFGEKEIGYGYGVRINDKQSPKIIGHTGMGNGFASINLFFPESDLSVIILENTMNEDAKISYYFELEIQKIIANSILTKNIR